MTENIYPEPRTPLSDAATDVGRHLNLDDASWLIFVATGYSTAHPELTPRETNLHAITLFTRARHAIDNYVRALVAGARRDGASWTAVGEALGVSKQTAFSRYGSMTGERDGQVFLNDIVRDREIPLTPIHPGEARPEFHPVPATPAQLDAIAKHFEGTDAAKPENLPGVANALMVNAQKIAANEGANWSDPTVAEKYLEIVLAMFTPKR
ncbi:hypothetical protein [Mycolicibacterium mageritense]|uniref:hypothetical protein n=1 Tax=Mycolicibacterium mageritense TaxID=53462 RepID=UPI001E383286|nr:hypothetical protein [Mycolicibacterium mageritense]